MNKIHVKLTLSHFSTVLFFLLDMSALLYEVNFASLNTTLAAILPIFCSDVNHFSPTFSMGCLPEV